MEIIGDVLNANIEDRELVGKDGTKKPTKVSHVLLICKSGDAKSGETMEVVNLRCYNATWPLPAIGAKGWKTPRIKKYENFDGNVAEVMV